MRLSTISPRFPASSRSCWVRARICAVTGAFLPQQARAPMKPALAPFCPMGEGRVRRLSSTLMPSLSKFILRPRTRGPGGMRWRHARDLTKFAAPIGGVSTIGGTRSSAGEHSLHTGGVTGSIPVASTKLRREAVTFAHRSLGVGGLVKRPRLRSAGHLWRVSARQANGQRSLLMSLHRHELHQALARDLAGVNISVGIDG